MEKLETRLEKIGREYVHRHTNQVDFDALLGELVAVAHDIPRTEAYGEFWLRTFNDACDFTAGWGTLSADEGLDSISLWQALEQQMLEFPLNVTQKLRLKSIAMRTRAAWAAACPETVWKDIYEDYLAE